jgi:hypothetical protein
MPIVAIANCRALRSVVEFAQLEDLLMNARASLDPLWFCAPFDEAERRRTLIAECAYFRAQRRGFTPGHELEDWLAAEAEVDEILRGGHDGAKAPAASKR